MKYVIDSYNATSMGTSTVTEYLLKYLSEKEHISCYDRFYVVLSNSKRHQEMRQLVRCDNARLVCFYNYGNYFRFVFRCFYDFLFFPLFTFFVKPKSVLIMANYCPIKVFGKKIVFVRHSYLVDDNICLRVSLGTRVIEKLRRLYFKLTIKSTDVIIVQTNYMKRLISDKYALSNIDIKVLPNPITDMLSGRKKRIKRPTLSEFFFLYPSRYYPHKNHSFIVKLAQKYSSELREKNMKFLVTINPKLAKDTVRLLNLIRNEGLDDIVINIGELSQEELVEYYLKAELLFFPSKSESFGNPIVEAMALGLPIVVPDLDYARILCEDSAVYYKRDDIHDAYNKLISICENDALWNCYSQKSFEQSKSFPSVSEWAHKLLTIMKS
jgi:glycosyltransferase involved in cell wall biosynthesis